MTVGVCIYNGIYLYMYIYTNLFMYTCLFIMYTYTYVVSIHIYMYICISTHIYTYIQILAVYLQVVCDCFFQGWGRSCLVDVSAKKQTNKHNTCPDLNIVIFVSGCVLVRAHLLCSHPEGPHDPSTGL